MTKKNTQPMYYSPIRSLVICLLITSLPFLLLRELASISLENITVTAVGFFETINSNWMARFSERMINEPFKLFLFWMGLVVVCYSLFQYIGLIQDTTFLRLILVEERQPRSNGLVLLVNRISGRPRSLFKTWDGKNDPQNDLRAHLEYGENALMSPLRFYLTAFPMMGFLGTVVGLAGAIRHLPKAMQSEGALQSVLDNLYIAFDTTFLGLVGALISLMLIKYLEIHWDKLAQMVEVYKD